MAEGVTTRLENFYKEHTWLTLGAIIVGGFILYQLWKNFMGGGSSSGANSQDSGQYYVAYVDDQQPSVTNITNNDSDDKGDKGGGPPQGHNLIQRVRLRFSQPGVKSYDTANPQGVPVRSSPGGRIIGFAPYGSNISLQSLTPITGPSNIGNKPKTLGSDLWYQVANLPPGANLRSKNSIAGGYISQYDIIGFNNSQSSR